MHDEGVIKFTCHWRSGPAPASPLLQSLIAWRDRLWAVNLIGVYPNGVGYGNISVRLSQRSFLISGTQTGDLAETHPCHYALVDDWDIDRNALSCTGPVKASSESLTHAALYEYSDDIQAIIHGHNQVLWRRYQHRLPTTAASVPYGTPAMAHEMWRLMKDSDLPQQQILFMAGHEEGMLTFGPTLAAAAEVLARYHPISPQSAMLPPDQP